MGRRTWFKIFSGNWLRGTLRDESPVTRGIFADILALANDSAYGDDGIIKLSVGVGLTDEQFAGILKISFDEWREAKLRFITTERIEVDGDNIITVLNWKKYQSEYRRQKQCRQNALATNSRPDGNCNSHVEKEG